MPLQPGLYQHYKGPQYRVFNVARHSETEEEVVFYQALYGDFGFWVRPLSMFLETVEVDGEQVPRFQRGTAFRDRRRSGVLPSTVWRLRLLGAPVEHVPRIRRS